MAQDRSKNDNKANAGAPSAESDEAPAFAQRVEEFAHALQVERNASPHTIRNYTMDLHDFGRWAKRSKADALSPTHRQLRRYLANLDAGCVDCPDREFCAGGSWHSFDFDGSRQRACLHRGLIGANPLRDCR